MVSPVSANASLADDLPSEFSPGEHLVIHKQLPRGSSAGSLSACDQQLIYETRQIASLTEQEVFARANVCMNFKWKCTVGEWLLAFSSNT